MIKSLKSLAYVMIILSLLFFVGGMVFSKLAEENRGSKISSGYMKNGEFIATDVGVIGANKKGEETAEAVSVVSYVLGGMLLLSGVGFIVVAQKKNNAKLIRQNGTIIEKENSSYVSVIVEFDDNSRKKLIVEPPLIVAQGDRGMLGYKGNLLVEFSKE